MTSFGWKRKVGEKVARAVSTAFEKEAKDDEDNEVEAGEVDWLSLAPKRRFITLEDPEIKSNRLCEEGAVLAEADRPWEAIKKWDEALQLTPYNEKLYEMKAQAYLAVCEVFPAVQAARKAVQLKPTWWVAYQTLGRAQLGLGEVRLALRNFCKALHINPCDRELWEEDLAWAISLLKKHTKIQQVTENNTKCDKEPRIVELDSDGQCSSVQPYERHPATPEDKEPAQVSHMPQDYIQMRDPS